MLPSTDLSDGMSYVRQQQPADVDQLSEPEA